MTITVQTSEWRKVNEQASSFKIAAAINQDYETAADILIARAATYPEFFNPKTYSFKFENGPNAVRNAAEEFSIRSGYVTSFEQPHVDAAIKLASQKARSGKFKTPAECIPAAR